jgi:predicted amidophosphoribosyltransferase
LSFTAANVALLHSFIMNWFIDFWLPTKCLICGEPPKQICRSCSDSLVAKPRMVSRSNLVPGVAAVEYQGLPKELVHHLKVLGPATVAGLMANRILAAAESIELDGARGDWPRTQVYLVPVPSRKEMTRIRGFVPSVLLAKKIARGLGEVGVAARVKHIAKLSRSVKDQAGLSRQDREANLSGAMRVTVPFGEAEKAAIIWMVDDVVTTGASLRELQRCLTTAGWNVQRFLTFAETL